MIKILLSALLLISFQVNAVSITFTGYVEAWGGSDLAELLSQELDLIQTKADTDGKFFELLTIESWPEYGTIYFLYNLSDREGEINPLLTKVAYVEAWTGSNLHKNIQDKINFLQIDAFNSGNELNIFDIKITPGYCYIVYETQRTS